MNRSNRCTAEVVARILKIARDNPEFSHRLIGSRFSPPISKDTVGKVLRGERGVTVGPDGRMLNHRGGRPKKAADLQ